MRITALLISLLSLTGCKSRSAPPAAPGVSAKLAYPVLLIGQASLDVCDSENGLVSQRGASSLNLNERRVLDSQGRLYRVKRAEPIAGQRSPMWSMGTDARLYFVEVAEQARPSWAQIQELVLEQVLSPSSTWNGDARAVARVREFRGVGELIESSRESWNWAR
jgi:hypothetical protein